MNRTLVKSPPELWSELSEVERLANHLGEFGEIEISRLEPEHTVAWEGEHASGTVEIEASGWGTKVTMKAEVREIEPEPEPEPPPVPTPPAPTVHKVIPDLEAWDRSAAEIERAAHRHTPAAERAAEREALRAAEARRRRKGLAGWLFRSRREREPMPEPPAPSWDPPPPEPVHWSGEAQAVEAPHAEPVESEPQPVPEPARRPEPAVGEDRARAVLEAALDNLGAAHHRPFSRG